MERAGHQAQGCPESHRQEFTDPPRRLVGFGMFLRRFSSYLFSISAPSPLGGRRHEPVAPVGRAPAQPIKSPPSTELKQMAQSAAARAIYLAEREARHEAGHEYGRICPPLLLGPQRYRDPKIWVPESMQDDPLGEENLADYLAMLDVLSKIDAQSPDKPS